MTTPPPPDDISKSVPEVVIVPDTGDAMPLGEPLGGGNVRFAQPVEKASPSSDLAQMALKDISNHGLPLSNASSTSIATTATSSEDTPSKRQAEFEKHFKERLIPPGGDAGFPEDYLFVIGSQSADLQAKILVHGRLYLTRYHLCFRANILGIRTEKIHAIKDLIMVKKSTTAKWIQNAVEIAVCGSASPDGEEKVYGYGSMADRDMMYEDLSRWWKIRAERRYEDYRSKEVEKEKTGGGRSRSGTAASSMSVASVASATSAASAVSAKTTDTVDTSSSTDSGSTGKPTPTEGVKQTECSGEHFKEVALDTKLPMAPKQLFELIYENKEFGRDFLENKQKLTDINVSEWIDVEGKKKRTLEYVMHLSIPFGPSKSDCFGSEIIERSDPEQVYEIVSETKTPGVPSGKNFKIVTRTCLTHDVLEGKPATRMYCTTQCDWSSSSMLKGTITPATIKGQQDYHRQLVSAIQEWIASHPHDFQEATTQINRSQPLGQTSSSIAIQSKGNPVDKGHIFANGSRTKSYFDYAMEIPNNPVMMVITALLALSTLLNYYTLLA